MIADLHFKKWSQGDRDCKIWWSRSCDHVIFNLNKTENKFIPKLLVCNVFHVFRIKIDNVNACFIRKSRIISYITTFFTLLPMFLWVYKYKDRSKDREIVELRSRSDRRWLFKLGSESRSRSQFLMKIEIGIAISILAIGVCLGDPISDHFFPCGYDQNLRIQYESIQFIQKFAIFMFGSYPQGYCQQATKIRAIFQF